MKWLKGIILGVILLAVGAVALGLFYFLPQHDVVMVTGVICKPSLAHTWLPSALKVLQRYNSRPDN